MHKFIKFEQINSTNKYALENIGMLEDKTVIIADIQSAGRGRFSRRWVSDKKGNCYISFVLKPNPDYRNNYPNLTQYLSFILCQEIEKHGVKPTIKWPNYVQINGKKIAGILSEVAYSAGKLVGIVLGLGVNLNLTAEDLEKIDIPATSLNLETNKSTDRDEFINNLAESFFKRYEIIVEKGFGAIRAEYLLYCNFIGKEIMIKNPEPTNLGVAIGISQDGALEILTSDGKVQKILSGDVILN